MLHTISISKIMLTILNYWKKVSGIPQKNVFIIENKKDYS